MAKTRRRGGALADYLSYANPLNWGKSMADIKAAKCAKATAASDAASKTKDEACAGESTAEETPAVADASAEMSGAPAAPAGQSPPPASTGGRSRRRRQTRRKYKGGRHRRGH